MSKQEPIYRIPPDYKARAITVAQAESLAWPWKFLGIEEVWKKTTGKKPNGSPIKLAILDTGLAEHVELQDQVFAYKNFTRSRNGVKDVHGHSAWCCGAACARWRNNVGGAGIAPDGKLLVGKVLNDDGSGDDRAIAAGILWAAFDENVDGISMSFGGPQGSPIILDAINQVRRGRPKCFMFAASGNDGGPINYPGGWVIGVGASDDQGRITKFTSRGPELDIIAPGVEIPGLAPDNGYQVSTGSSMATPIAAAVGMLAYALDPEGFTDNDDMEAELKHTAAVSGPWKLIDPRKLIADRGQLPVAGAEWNLGVCKIRFPSQSGDWFSVGA